MVLLTYHFRSRTNPDHRGFHYQVAESATAWIEAMQTYDDGDYVLINVLPITDEQSVRYDGNLRTM